MSKLTISKLYNYKHLKPYIGLEGNIPVKHKDVFVGVEIELETAYPKYKINTYTSTNDGSLKIAGKEFVTIPIKMRYLEVELRRIFEGLQVPPLVSKRCSVHVHMNVRDMTINQVLNFIMLYMIFERSLYRISGDRWDSNFCIPLAQAHVLVYELFKYWENNFSWNWNKYTGLNLCPIFGGESGQIGTVEFRQLHGTTDVEEIMQWCNLATALKRAAQDIDQEELLSHIKILNITGNYEWLAKQVFGSYAKLLTDQSTFKEDCEWCVTNLKFLLPEKKLVTKTKKEELNIYDEVYLELINSVPVSASLKKHTTFVAPKWVSADAPISGTEVTTFTLDDIIVEAAPIEPSF